MSRRRRVDEEDDEDDEEDDDEDDFPDEEDVEYLLVELDDDSVRTSVPKSLHSSQSSSSAPSTLTVVSDDLEAPHISHWGITPSNRAHCIKDAPSIPGRPTGRPRAAGPVTSLRGPTGLRHVRSDHAPQKRCRAVR
jgi:hypothetical protein